MMYSYGLDIQKNVFFSLSFREKRYINKNKPVRKNIKMVEEETKVFIL